MRCELRGTSYEVRVMMCELRGGKPRTSSLATHNSYLRSDGTRGRRYELRVTRCEVRVARCGSRNLVPRASRLKTHTCARAERADAGTRCELRVARCESGNLRSDGARGRRYELRVMRCELRVASWETSDLEPRDSQLIPALGRSARTQVRGASYEV